MNCRDIVLACIGSVTIIIPWVNWADSLGCWKMKVPGITWNPLIIVGCIRHGYDTVQLMTWDWEYAPCLGVGRCFLCPSPIFDIETWICPGCGDSDLVGLVLIRDKRGLPVIRHASPGLAAQQNSVHLNTAQISTQRPQTRLRNFAGLVPLWHGFGCHHSECFCLRDRQETRSVHEVYESQHL